MQYSWKQFLVGVNVLRKSESTDTYPNAVKCVPKYKAVSCQALVVSRSVLRGGSLHQPKADVILVASSSIATVGGRSSAVLQNKHKSNSTRFPR